MAISASLDAGGFPDVLGRGVLCLNGLTDRGQAAPEQLLGHRDLLRPQRGQHGVAVHRRGRSDRTFASGSPSFASFAPFPFTRPPAPGPARTAAPGATTPGPRRATGGSLGSGTLTPAATLALFSVVAVSLVPSTAPLGRSRSQDDRDVWSPAGGAHHLDTTFTLLG